MSTEKKSYHVVGKLKGSFVPDNSKDGKFLNFCNVYVLEDVYVNDGGEGAGKQGRKMKCTPEVFARILPDNKYNFSFNQYGSIESAELVSDLFGKK